MDQEEVSWDNVGQLKDYFVNVLQMKDDDNLAEAAEIIYNGGAKTINYLRNIQVSSLTSVGVNIFVAQGLANKLKTDGEKRSIFG